MRPERNTCRRFGRCANPPTGATVISVTTNFPRELLTERLSLRAATLDDAPRIFARYGQDPEVSRYLTWTPHRSIEDTRAFLSRVVADNTAGRSAGWLIFSRSDGELLGSIGGTCDGSRVGFGYCLARDAWGNGFATEAARAFLVTLFQDPSLWRVQAYCDLENPASARVLEQAGLTLEGTLRRLIVLPNLGETPRDVFCYAKVRG